MLELKTLWVLFNLGWTFWHLTVIAIYIYSKTGLYCQSSSSSQIYSHQGKTELERRKPVWSFLGGYVRCEC